MEKWFEAYSNWGPTNQLLFSFIAMAVTVVVLFLLGLWSLQLASHITIWLRGWPPEKHIVPNAARVAELRLPPMPLLPVPPLNSNSTEKK